jgi:hypothetical protein
VTYLEECNKYFAPLDEIQEALDNGEGLCGISNKDLIAIVNSNPELAKDLLNCK